MDSLSGNAYVPMRLKEDPEKTKPKPTKISSAKLCSHELTICTQCWGEWDADYVIFWSRTAGGRKLRVQVLG